MNMRELITLCEGKLVNIEGTSCYGYWYQPSTGRTVDVSWDADNDEHHADKVMKDPEFFGLSADKSRFYDADSEDIRGIVIDNGWVRITVTDLYARHGFPLVGIIEGKSLKDCRKTAIWLLKNYPEICRLDISCHEAPLVKLDRDNLEIFLKRGVLPRT